MGAFHLHCHFNIRDLIARVYIAARTELTSISLLAQCTVAGVEWQIKKNKTNKQIDWLSVSQMKSCHIPHLQRHEYTSISMCRTGQQEAPFLHARFWTSSESSAKFSPWFLDNHLHFRERAQLKITSYAHYGGLHAHPLVDSAIWAKIRPFSHSSQLLKIMIASRLNEMANENRVTRLSTLNTGTQYEAKSCWTAKLCLLQSNIN